MAKFSKSSTVIIANAEIVVFYKGILTLSRSLINKLKTLTKEGLIISISLLKKRMKY